MSISAPRYAAGPLPRLSPVRRLLAIYGAEVRRRGWWGTLVGTTLLFVLVDLTIVLNSFFASLTGGVSATTFVGPVLSPTWPFLVLIVATAAGAGAIADDLGSRAITLYLARPIRRTDYLLAKAGGCGTWLLIATVGPGLAGVALAGTLGYGSATLLLDAAAGYVVVGLLTAVFFTGLALALSSLVDRSLYAGVAIFGIVLALLVGTGVVGGVTGNPYVPYASPVGDILSVAQAVFGAGTSSTDPGGSAAILGGSGVLLTMFAGWRLSRVEVVGE